VSEQEFSMPETGSVTIPLYHCLVNDGGTITHWATTFDRSLYDSLPHLYLVCLADNRVQPRPISGAFMVKTSRHHNDDDFASVMNGAARQMATLSHLMGPEISMLPARIGVEGEPPEEIDFLRLVMQQVMKFGAGGRA
jgi:hypothetical protein